MEAMSKEQAIKLIKNIFPATEINHIGAYEYIFIKPDNPVLSRNVGRLIFKDAEVEVTLDIYDNSPSPWSFFKLKIKLHGEVILVQTGEYDNISYKVETRETDYYKEEALKTLYFDDVIIL